MANWTARQNGHGPPFGARLLACERGRTFSSPIAEKLDISQRAYAFWEREPIALRAEQLATLAKS